MTLAELQGRVREFSEARAWGQFHNPRNLAMAVSVEAGELLELFLWSADDGPQPPTPERKQRVEEEIADVLLCLLNLCERTGVDPTTALLEKLRAAELKYPVDRVRGSALKYDEYPEWGKP